MGLEKSRGFFFSIDGPVSILNTDRGLASRFERNLWWAFLRFTRPKRRLGNQIGLRVNMCTKNMWNSVWLGFIFSTHNCPCVFRHANARSEGRCKRRRVLHTLEAVSNFVFWSRTHWMYTNRRDLSSVLWTRHALMLNKYHTACYEINWTFKLFFKSRFEGQLERIPLRATLRFVRLKHSL